MSIISFVLLFCLCSFDDDSSISSGEISDTIAEISTDDIQSGSSISATSSSNSNHLHDG